MKVRFFLRVLRNFNYSSSINLGELFLYIIIFNRLKTMNRFEKWLWVNCTLKDNGQTSNSLYFYYKTLEIRYSDHISANSTGNLQIIKSSVFDSTNYAVIIKNSTKIMIANASNIIDFIIHYAQVNELLSISKTTFDTAISKNKLNLPETLYKPRFIKDAATNRIFEKKEDYWTNSEIKCLKQAVLQYFNQSCGFNTIFSRYLKENKVSFTQAINLYKILIFDNKTLFSEGNIDKVYNYIKSLEPSEIPKIQLD